MIAMGRGIFSNRLAIALFEPFDTVDKVDLQLMHNDFNGIKILSTVKAAGQIMLSIDGCIRTVAHRTGKGQFSAAAVSGKRNKKLNDALYGDFISQIRQFLGREATGHFDFAWVLFFWTGRFNFLDSCMR